MTRQSNHPRKDRKNEERRNDQSQPTVRSLNSGSQNQGDERNRPDNTRIAGLDKYRLNDLYERSSL